VYNECTIQGEQGELTANSHTGAPLVYSGLVRPWTAPWQENQARLHHQFTTPDIWRWWVQRNNLYCHLSSLLVPLHTYYIIYRA